MRYSINVKGVVDSFGGVEALVSKLVAAGVDDCGVKAVQKWLERKMIPMSRWLALKGLSPSLVLENFLVIEGS